MSRLVSIERRADGIALLALCRPQKRNALSLELREQLADALGECSGQDTGAIVLTGEGSAFCAGMDTTQFGGDRANRERIVASSIRLFGTLARCPTPVIAYLNGPAIAGGFALALLCDIRHGAPEARMGFPELGRYIPPSYAAARAALPASAARELCLSGRVIDAEEGLALGALSRIGTLKNALTLAGEISSAPHSAVREVKRRVLLEAERSWLPLLAEEERALREAVL